MFWPTDGAEAMLKLRGVFQDDVWDEFWEFSAKREKNRLYGKCENIHAVNQQEARKRKAAWLSELTQTRCSRKEEYHVSIYRPVYVQ